MYSLAHAPIAFLYIRTHTLIPRTHTYHLLTLLMSLIWTWKDVLLFFKYAVVALHVQLNAPSPPTLRVVHKLLLCLNWLMYLLVTCEGLA